MSVAVRTIDLDDLLGRLEALPTISLAQAGSPEQQLSWAREHLRKVGVVLRGHKTAIDKLLQYEIERKTAVLQQYDVDVTTALEAPTGGRPNKHSALRDLFIFTLCALVRTRLESKREQSGARDAQKRTAQFFRLTCDTKHARTRRPSLDQVKWAEQRTFRRFARLDRGAVLLDLAWTRAVYVLGFYIAETEGTPIDAEGFHAYAAALVSFCRTLDFVERIDRLNNSGHRKLQKCRCTAIARGKGASAN